MSGETRDEAAVRRIAEWEAQRAEIIAACGLPPDYVLPKGTPNLAAARMAIDMFAAAVKRRWRKR